MRMRGGDGQKASRERGDAAGGTPALALARPSRSVPSCAPAGPPTRAYCHGREGLTTRGGYGGARTAGELDGAGGWLQKAGSVRAFPRPPQVEGRLYPLLGGGLGVRGSLQTSLGTAAVRGSRPGWREREGVRARVAAWRGFVRSRETRDVIIF